MALFTSPPKSICVLRLSAIGDVCNTVAAVQCIQKQWPDTMITWVTGKLEARLLENISGVRVIVFDKKEGWKGYTKLWKQLDDERFDALLHMQYAFRASIAAIGIKAKYKLGFDSARSQDFQHLFTNIKVPSPQKMHVLDGLLAFAETLGVKDITPNWSITYSNENKNWALKHTYKAKRNLVVVPAASKAYKNWHAKGYADLLTHVHKLGWNIVLAGSPAQIEVSLSKEIEDLISFPVINLVGKSSLSEILALLDAADILVAPDTGPVHIANAMNTPVIGLYAHHNPERTGPYRYLDYVVSVYEEALKAETGKSPSEVSWRTRVKDKTAMNLIESKQVIDMFNKVVDDFDLK
ncbi:glycosyltransferase family 9 protein [Vibrio sp. S4M6]|uniref:glycosyltransferase family 9 protein n=1 Tax=Vibrio sinus TaxID=2946865 RepID=UPI00202A2EDA|nr:glycosyltransferase family 9 protein [Vibrio sinus]MCL9780355.1 glycosyltransferase family 9 protein [Vibrio sinus]